MDTTRTHPEEELERNYRIQTVLNTLLRVSLEDISLEEMLNRVIESIVSVPWIALESKGIIFLTEKEPNVLVMKAHRGLPETVRLTCARVPFGKCICGRVASSGKVMFVDCCDTRHETRYNGMYPHGHYCLPILMTGRLLGVVCLYLKEGHIRNRQEEDFLCAAADLLAGIIERKRFEESLRNSEKMLLKQKAALERKNIALSEILEQVEVEKRKIKDDVTANIEMLLLPALKKLRLTGGSRKYLGILQHDLTSLVSSFGRTISEKSVKLSTKEIEISDMIRSGLTSKEIAVLLNISRRTAEKHRYNIRKKFGILGKKINLTTFLQKY